MNHTIITRAEPGRQERPWPRSRLAAGLAAAAVLAAASAAAASTPAACTPLVSDAQGDTDPLLPEPRPDLDVLALDMTTSKDGKQVIATMRVVSLPATPVRAANYAVFFKAGKHGFRADADRALDGERFSLESDEPTSNGVANVRPISGKFDVETATVTFVLPVAELTDGKRRLGFGSVLYGISAVTVENFGTSTVTAGATVDDTTRDNIYRVGPRNCTSR